MKKEKKKYGIGRVILAFVIGLVIGAVLLCIAYYALREKGSLDWRTYIEEQLVPQAIAIAVSVGAALLAYKPVINGVASTVSAVIEKFKGATDDVNATVTASAKSRADVEAAVEEFGKIKDTVEEIRQNAAMLSGIAEELSAVRASVRDNVAISKLGFGSMIEHTKSGASREIMKIGEEVCSDGNEEAEA